MQPTSPARGIGWSPWLRPRYGLGALLFLVTLCSAAAWYWWRLPFEVERTGLHAWRGLELVVVERLEKPRRPVPSTPRAALDPFAASSSGSLVPDAVPDEQPQLKRRVKEHDQFVAREVESVRRLWGGRRCAKAMFVSLTRKES